MSKNMVDFCAQCFATHLDGSISATGTDGSGRSNFCMNCGEGFIIHIPKKAADTIRDGASWIGKRYYPDHEDYLNAAVKTEITFRDLQKGYGDLCSRIENNSYDLNPDDVCTVYTHNDKIIEVNCISDRITKILFTFKKERGE